MRLALTLPALERLLGGDAEIEVHLRQQVVDEFCRKKLKPLLNDATFLRVRQEWASQASREIDAQIATLWEPSDKDLRVIDRWNLNEAVKVACKNTVQEVLGELVETQRLEWERKITLLVSDAITRKVLDEINAGVKKRLGEIQQALASGGAKGS